MIDFKPTLLLVDDMQVNLVMLGAILKNEYHIKTARSATQALEIVALGGIDLILLDVVMPDMDGYTMCTLLKNDEKTQDIPVIFVTGSSSKEDEEKGFLVGAVDFIRKPFEATTVKNRVKTHINLRLRQIELETISKTIQEQNQKLKRYTQLVEVILDNQKNIILLTNGKRLTQANKVFSQFFGFTDLEDFLKSHQCICEFFIKEDGYLSTQMGELDWISYVVQNPTETNLAKIIQNENEYIFKVYGRIVEKNIQDGEDYVVVTLEDITQELMRQKELKAKSILLQQQSRLAALGEMIGNIAHQWRQPLSVITMVISGMKVKQDFGIPITDESISEVTDTIMNQANYLSKTIDDFRDFIKNDTIQESFNLSQVINDTANLLDATLKSNYIKLTLTTDDTLVYTGEPNQLSQVIMNIVNNAKDAFTEKNQKHKEIVIKSWQDDHSIKIEVTDNAGGIDEEIKEKIFDPYFTTKHQSQGTGLGLFICSNIIQKYFDGKITIEDVEEKIEEDVYTGTKFIIEFEANQTVVQEG